MNISNSSNRALDWLEEKSGIQASVILNSENSFSELMALRHLHRAVLCERFRKGQVSRQLGIGGNSINNSLKYHHKNLQSRVYRVMYEELKTYVYENK